MTTRPILFQVLVIRVTNFETEQVIWLREIKLKVSESLSERERSIVVDSSRVISAQDLQKSGNGGMLKDWGKDDEGSFVMKHCSMVL